MYYEVLVASQRYHRDEALTYSSDVKLPIGSIVVAPLQQERVLAIVVGTAHKPTFPVKPIEQLIFPAALAPYHLRLIDWLRAYYPAPGGLIHGLFAPRYLSGPLTSAHQPGLRRQTTEPTLTPAQTRALKEILAAPGHSVLLHGITGSGKTRIYSELAKRSIREGKSVIILTPEIGLTPQLTSHFSELFDNCVVLHSTMTPKERRAAWAFVATHTKPVVIIGPRSALFAPVKKLGLIVVDEMHDTAYKQEQAPYYQTSRVAAKLAELAGAKVILASATPPIADYWLFEQHRLPIVSIDELAATAKPVTMQTKVIDLKNASDFTQSPLLSDTLIASINEALGKREQTLLFLNRRGTARVILCQVCGWQASCPRCDLPLTYHGDTHTATCHTCGYSQPAPSSCESCGAADIIFRSAGTKSVITELERLFPKAATQRFDSDIKKGQQLSMQYQEIQSGKVDILVGTQMLGKGLDLPKLSVVGVIMADTGLNFPDFTASERTFQMLTQVAGRVGRGHRDSTIIVQTYNPDSTVIQQALARNYQQFYRDQIIERKTFMFPPFCHILKLTCTRKSRQAAMAAAQKVTSELAMLKLPVTIIGPAPAFLEKQGNEYHWQIVIKSPQRSILLRIIKKLPANWQYDIDPAHLL